MNIKSIIRTFFHRVSKTLAVIVLTMTAQTVWATPTVQFPIYTDDEGTELNPYQIKSIDDLNKLAADVNSGTGYGDKYFKLVNDLSFSYTTAWNSTDAYTSNFTPIGTTVGTTIYLFQGHFDGNNKTISGLRINSDSNFQGLFGSIYSTAEVKNVTIADARITGNSYTGGVVGINGGGTVTNCHVMANVAIVASGIGYGGVVGCNNGTVSCCSSAVKIIKASGNPSYLGGLVGWNYSSSSDATLTDNFVIGADIPTGRNNTHAAIAVDDKTSNRYHVHYERNYYYNCTVAGIDTDNGKGIRTYNDSPTSPTSIGDISTDDGAVYKAPYTITAAAGVTVTSTPASAFTGTSYYCIDGATVTLNGRPAAPMGYVYPYIVNGADVIGETFVMPTENVNVVVSTVLGTADYAIGGPDGNSEATAYQIYTPEQLDLLAQRVNSGTNYAYKYFKLMNDIAYTHTTAWNDATSTENNFTAIGIKDHFFLGTFDGGDHTISGIRIYKGGSGTSDSYQGLFGYVGGTVKDVTLANARITGYRYVGGIVGDNVGGIVTGCHVAPDVNLHVVQSYVIQVGGIVGDNNDGTVSGCTSAVKMTVMDGLTNNDFFGGIVGYNDRGTVSDCRAIGAVVPAFIFAGAIVGSDQNNNTTLSDNTYHSCLVGSNAFNIGVYCGDMTGATLDNTALYLDDYMDAPALIAAYDDPSHHTALSGAVPNVNNLTVTLKRTFPAGKKQTVCLPFAPGELLTGNKGKVWEFTGISDKKAVMTECTSGLQANTPYIFEATANETSLTFSGVTVSYVADPKTVNGTDNFTFHGTYEQKHWLATSDEVVNGTIYGFMIEDNDGQTTGQFVRARRETYLRPFSCYLEYDGELTGTQTAAARRMTRADIETLPDVIDIVWQPAGGTTGISDASHLMDNGQWTMDHEAGAGWYSLDGRRLNGRPTAKGIYVRGGKKFIIK